MSAVNRVKQILMVTGLLTILAGAALAGMIVYLWWDARRTSEGFEADTDFEPETDVDASVETEISDDETDIATTDTESDTDTQSESGTAPD